MMGLVRVDAGDITILGRAMPACERWIKARVGVVSEDMALYGAMSLRWHMDLVAAVHEGWDERRADVLLERLDLNPDQRTRGMSRGQQVKAMLLLALARRAEVLILDEPTTGLDPLVRHELMTLLAGSRDERQAIVFSSHHGEDVSALADDVAFLHAGKIIAKAPVSNRSVLSHVLGWIGYYGLLLGAWVLFFSVVLAAAIVTESIGWTIAVLTGFIFVVGNVVLQIAPKLGWVGRYVKNLAHGGPALPVTLGVEALGIALVVTPTLTLQGRKTSFV